jgi:hypothetical protein
VEIAERLEHARVAKLKEQKRHGASTYTHHHRRTGDKHHATLPSQAQAQARGLWAPGEARVDRTRGARGDGHADAPWEADEPPGKIEREWGAAATMRTHTSLLSVSLRLLIIS